MSWLVVLIVENVALFGWGGVRRWRWHLDALEAQRQADAEQHENDRHLAPPIPLPPQPVTQGTYRKKPLMVEVCRWDGSYDAAQEILEWVGEDRGVYQEAIVPSQSTDVAPLPAEPAHLFIYCAEGAVEVHKGYSVVKEPGHVGGRSFTVLSPEDVVDLLDLIEER